MSNQPNYFIASNDNPKQVVFNNQSQVNVINYNFAVNTFTPTGDYEYTIGTILAQYGSDAPLGKEGYIVNWDPNSTVVSQTKVFGIAGNSTSLSDAVYSKILFANDANPIAPYVLLQGQILLFDSVIKDANSIAIYNAFVALSSVYKLQDMNAALNGVINTVIGFKG